MTKFTFKPTVALPFLLLCVVSDRVAGQMSFPQPATAKHHGWEMCVPEDESVDSAKLQRAMQYMEEALDDPKTADAEEDRLEFACVLRNGRMIWPNHTTPVRQGSDLNTPCQIYSATKTFGTGVLGLLVDQGLADLDMLANAIIDIDLTQEDGQDTKEYSSYDKISLRHLATFTDGFQDVRPKWPKPGMYYPFNPEPPRFTPGSKFAYNSSPQVLAYCMTKLIYNRFSCPPHSWPKPKCNLDAYFDKFVATRIGMARDDWRWSNEFPDPGQHLINLSNPEDLDVRPISQSMFMSAATMARWGHLFLNRGNWDGQQIISRSYIEEATTVQVPKEMEPDNRRAGYRDAPGRYGFMWWINGRGGWTQEGPKRPSVLIWPDAPQRTSATQGVCVAAGFQSNLCIIIHTLHASGGEASSKEVPANMVVVRLARGVAPDGKRSTPGDFTAEEHSHLLKLLGKALLPQRPRSNGDPKVGIGPAVALPGLKVSPDGHFLVKDDENNTPFVWLGDTGWRINKINSSEVEQYLQNRSKKGFTVIQAMAILNKEGPENFNGDHPFCSLDPVRLNEPYWQHVDCIVDKAEELGMYVALFTMWGTMADDFLTSSWFDLLRIVSVISVLLSAGSEGAVAAEPPVSSEADILHESLPTRGGSSSTPTNRGFCKSTW